MTNDMLHEEKLTISKYEEKYESLSYVGVVFIDTPYMEDCLQEYYNVLSGMKIVDDNRLYFLNKLFKDNGFIYKSKDETSDKEIEEVIHEKKYMIALTKDLFKPMDISDETRNSVKSIISSKNLDWL